MGFLGWMILFLVIAVVAGALGFTGIAAGAALIFRVLFGIFLVIALFFLIMMLIGWAAVTQAPTGFEQYVASLGNTLLRF